MIPVDSTDAIDIEHWGPRFKTQVYFRGRQRWVLAGPKHHRRQAKGLRAGVGETLACGTGACAAMVAGVRNGWFGDSVQLRLTRGSLTLEYRDGESIFMTGPGEFVFEGSARL